MKKIVFTILSCASLFALDDTFENRSKEADRYIEIMSMKTILLYAFEKGANSKAKNDEEKKLIKELAKKYLNTDEIISELKDVLVKHYTADEIVAMNSFYSSAEGKSILKKQTDVSMEMSKKMQNIVFKMLMNIMNDKTLQKNKPIPQQGSTQTAI